MAVVRPLAAIAYARTGSDVSTLAAPPYDVISDTERAAFLARDDHNVVALELPEGPADPGVPGNSYEIGGRRWREWRASGVLRDEGTPALWCLEQRFELGSQRLRRRAFIVEVGLEPLDAGIVLPHERTLPKALGDRFELLKTTAANLSQVFGLFSDPEGETDALFDCAASRAPDLRATDDDGVESLAWRCDDSSGAEALARLMADRQILIADGHHRYTVALAYRDERRAADGRSHDEPATAPYDFIMMALVNMDDPDLVVLPTHRVVRAVGGYDVDSVREGLERYFDFEEMPAAHRKSSASSSGRPGFIVKLRGEHAPFVARLRDDVDLQTAITTDHSAAWKELDVAVLQELVLDPLFGIHPDSPETLEGLAFVKDPHEALEMVPHWDAAFVLEPTRLDQMRAVAAAREIMPQKSTYFYPKLLSGLLFRSAD